MKVCCSNGKPYDTLTDFERLGGCSSDHCKGPIEVEFNPEGMPISEGLDLSECKEFHIEDYFLSSHGTFDTKDCISHEDMRHLFKVKENEVGN